ncbi:GFA family protein [Bradyrhizobium sp. 23AC]
MLTYREFRHCGSAAFSLVSEIAEMTTCDCSLCRQESPLITEVHKRALTVESGEDLWSIHKWNTQRAQHFFCSRCGIATFRCMRAAPDHLGGNAFCPESFAELGAGARD